MGEPAQLPGQLDIRGIWNFTPSAENNGLTKMFFLASSIGYFPGQDTNVASSIEWQFDPTFIPPDTQQTISKIETEGVQKGLSAERTVRTVKFFSTFMLLAPYLYLTLPLREFPNGGQNFLTQVSLYQLGLSLVHLAFAFFLLRFILKRFKQLRFGLFWVFIGVLIILIFYMVSEFMFVRFVQVQPF